MELGESQLTTSLLGTRSFEDKGLERAKLARRERKERRSMARRWELKGRKQGCLDGDTAPRR